MPFGTATVLTNKGKALFADRARTTPGTYSASPKYIGIGTGISAAFVSDGILLHGSGYSAGEMIGGTIERVIPSDKLRESRLIQEKLRREQEASIVRRRLLELEPDFSVSRFVATTPLERETDKLHYAQGLRLAGLPEHEAELTGVH